MEQVEHIPLHAVRVSMCLCKYMCVYSAYMLPKPHIFTIPSDQILESYSNKLASPVAQW